MASSRSSAPLDAIAQQHHAGSAMSVAISSADQETG